MSVISVSHDRPSQSVKWDWMNLDSNWCFYCLSLYKEFNRVFSTGGCFLLAQTTNNLNKGLVQYTGLDKL